MPNYQDSKIYKITANNNKLIYIGCTTNTLKIRFTAHKSIAKLTKLKTSYRLSRCTSSALFEYDDVKIELIENYPCSNKIDILLRERHYMDLYECVNKYKTLLPHESVCDRRRYKYINNIDNEKDKKKEYYLKNKEKAQAYAKIYYQQNKEKMNETSRQYRIRQSEK